MPVTRHPNYTPSGGPSYAPSDVSWRFASPGGGHATTGQGPLEGGIPMVVFSKKSGSSTFITGAYRDMTGQSGGGGGGSGTSGTPTGGAGSAGVVIFEY